jgi:hypothetical protein
MELKTVDLLPTPLVPNCVEQQVKFTGLTRNLQVDPAG